MDRLEEHQMACQYNHMTLRSPHQIAELVANHYLKNTQMAFTLLDAVKLRKQIVTSGGGDPAKLETLIESYLARITNSHREDLGIELAWPKKQTYAD